MDGTCRCSAALPHLRRRCRGRHNSVKPSFPPVSFSLSLSLRLLRPVCKIDDGRRSRCCCRFSIARARSILPKLFCATLFCRWVSGALHGRAKKWSSGCNNFQASRGRCSKQQQEQKKSTTPREHFLAYSCTWGGSSTSMLSLPYKNFHIAAFAE